MVFEKFQNLELPATADFHVHLRDGDMMETVVPTIRQGGVNTVFVMPNLVPPVTSVKKALDYKSRLQKLEPNVTFLMSLYLHPDITPAVIREAKEAGIVGVKSYPAGVTTNSSSGVLDYESFYPVFAEMEKQDMILNLHGEVPNAPSGPGADVTVMDAEERFLPTLHKLHADFPNLRIILEHCTTAAAVQAVSQCGRTVAGTITAHHLYLSIDDVVGRPFHFCKPVAKLPGDRLALVKAAVSRNSKFFFGSDSAPHPANKKTGGVAAAGVFTQPYVTQLVLDALEKGVEKGWIAEDEVIKETLQGFLSGFGRAFYGFEDSRSEEIVLTKGKSHVRHSLVTPDAEHVVLFREGQPTWTVTWKK